MSLRGLDYVCMAMATLGVGVGLSALANPISFTRTFGIPFTSEPTGREKALIRIIAGRNVSMVLPMLALTLRTQRYAQSVMLLAGSTSAAVDAFITAQAGSSKEALGHALAAVTSLSLGLWYGSISQGTG